MVVPECMVCMSLLPRAGDVFCRFPSGVFVNLFSF